MGLVLGTAVPPNKISVAFAIVLTPLIFTGATFYPWAALDSLPLVPGRDAVQPADLRAAGLRAALTTAPHLGAGWIALGLVGSTLIFGGLGLRGFARRAVD